MDAIYKRGLEANLWKFKIHDIFQRRSYYPILAVSYMALPGSQLQEVGYFMAAGSFVAVILEVPSGYIADKLGHKNGLILSFTCFFISSLLFIVSSSLVGYIVASIFLAGGWAFRSGTSAAFLHETLKALGKDHQYASVASAIQRTGLLTGAVLLTVIPATAAIDLRVPFAISSAFDLIGLLTVASMVVPQKTHVAIKEISQTNFIEVLHEAHRRHFIPIALFVGFYLAIPIAASSFRDLYQQSLGIDVALLGALLGASRLVAGLITPTLSRLKPFLTMKQWFVIQALTISAFMALVGMSTDKWIVAALFVILVGFFWAAEPLSQHYQLEYLTGSNFKATILSFVGLLQRFFTSGLQLFLGWLIGVYAYGAGFVLYAGFGFVALILLLGVLVSQVPTQKRTT